MNAQAAAVNHQPAVEVVNLEQVVSFYPQRRELWERLGMAALQAGQAEKAIKGLLQAEKLGVLSTDETIALGDAYAQAGNLSQAVATWERIQLTSVPTVDLLQRLEKSYQVMGDYPGRLRTLEQWVKWYPQDAKAVYRLGLWKATHQPEEGLNELLQAGRMDPGLESSVRILQAGVNAGFGLGDLSYQLLQTGRAMGSLGEWEAAAEAFKQAVQTNPANADAWAFLSQAQQHLGLDSQPALSQALALNPDSLVAKVMQALYWQQQGEIDKALPYLKDAAAQEPDNGIWQIDLGNIAAQEGDLQTAFASYQKAVQTEPDNPFYWRVLAGFTVNFNYRVSDIGLPAARQAVALAPEDPANLDVLGQVLAVLEDLTTAERLFQRALAQDSHFSPAYLHLGMVYLTEGNRPAAIQALSQAVRFANTQALKDQAQRLLDQYSR